MAIEALLYESTTLSDKLAGEINSVPPSVVDMKIKPEPPGAYGFPGHLLEGKLENPKLWSGEKVHKIFRYKDVTIISDKMLVSRTSGLLQLS